MSDMQYGAWLAESVQAARFATASFRAQQLQRLQQRGLPTKKDEQWKYTNVRYLEKSRFVQPEQTDIKKNSIQRWHDHKTNVITCVFINGHFVETLSNLELLPSEITLGALSNASIAESKTYLSREFDVQRYPFAVLNSALVTDGLFLQIPKNYVLERPIHLLFLSTTQDEFIACPRNIIIIGENSQATIIEEYVADQANNYFLNPLTEIHAASNAKVQYYKIQDESLTATHIAHLFVQQQKDSCINTFFADMGGRLVREEVQVNAHEQGTECHLHGLYVLRNAQQQIDNYVYVDHRAAQGKSSMVYKGILDNKSQAVFNGKVYVHASARQIQAQQENHNLLLSIDAVVNTKPELEIYADDVKCKHGATVGQLDNDSLFYLRSRGIDQEQALRLLTQAFAAEIVEQIAHEAVKQRVQQWVNRDATV